MGWGVARAVRIVAVNGSAVGPNKGLAYHVDMRPAPDKAKSVAAKAGAETGGRVNKGSASAVRRITSAIARG